MKGPFDVPLKIASWYYIENYRHYWHPIELSADHLRKNHFVRFEWPEFDNFLHLTDGYIVLRIQSVRLFFFLEEGTGNFNHVCQIRYLH